MKVDAMAENQQQPPLAPPPVNSPLAVREVKSLFLMVVVILVLVVFSLVSGLGLAWVIDTIVAGVFLSIIFQRR
jgi:membrane protein insertase Oxa1/YidC/SpoIIIJ